MKRVFLLAFSILVFAVISWAQTAPAGPPVQGEPARKQAKRHHAHPAEKHAKHPAERHQAHAAQRHAPHPAAHHAKPKAKAHKKSAPDANGRPPA